jgi:hypothetical protein
MRKKIGEVSFRIRIKGDVVAERKVEGFLWLHLSQFHRELFFTIKDYPIVAEWVVGKLGPSWDRTYDWNLRYVRITGTGDVMERFRELVRRGWVKEPEKARIKLISLLLLEGNVEKGRRN